MEMTDNEIRVMVKNMAVEMVGQASVRNADIIKMNGKEYRVKRAPRSENDYGEWEFLYNGKWHEVLNYDIRKQLNKELMK